MTDAINAVNSSSQASSNDSSTAITDDTKKELQALGLDPSKYTTEAQAEQAITQAQSQQQQGAQKSGGSNIGTIKTEVQGLASKMGVSIGTNDKMSDILSKISDKLGDLQSSAGNDPTKLSQFNSYQSQYTSISSELSQMEASRSKITNGLDQMADSNKKALGLS
jgi:hypothetical protein